MKTILYRYENGLLGWPEDWERVYNSCTEPCDMLIGPCACGASHIPECWGLLLDRYNSEIRHNPLNAMPEYVI